MVFKPDEISTSDHDLLRNIMVTSQDILEAWFKPARSTQSERVIHWVPTPEQTVKLNTDGPSRGNPELAGAVGVIRDSAGRWILGFAAHLGTSSNLATELHALRMGGLFLAWEEGDL